MAEKITPVTEDYLKIIMELINENGEARVTDIAERLNVKKPTVTQTIEKLTAMGLVVRESYGPVYLTSKGVEKASAIYEKYTTVRDFFITALGVDKTDSERNACSIEHIVSHETIEKMEYFLATHHD